VQITQRLSAYIADGVRLPLDAEVSARAKEHILDTFAAMISGTRLTAGRVARRYVRAEGGAAVAQVVGSTLLAPAAFAAFANGASAHADETDDSHAASGTHPGCAVVPAALALAEQAFSDGAAFQRAVVVGYEIGCRVGRALNPLALSDTGHSSRSLGNTFGACAAAAVLAGLDPAQASCALAYTAQQASGIGSYIRASDHIEKAFVLGGIPARNGVTAVNLVRAGALGTADPFAGERNFLQTYSPSPRPEQLTSGLGTSFEIAATSIKRYCVGSPIQAPLQALLELIAEQSLCAADVERLIVRVPARRAGTVDNRKMADVNLQLILALALVHRRITFAMTHDKDLSADSMIAAIQSRIELIGDPELSENVSARQARLELVTRNGKRLSKQLVTYRGTPEDPLSPAEIEDKARELVVPVIGREKTEELIQRVRSLEKVTDMRDLRELFVPVKRELPVDHDGGDYE
jgi:2-methylcitrate dehydratase PrpD